MLFFQSEGDHFTFLTIYYAWQKKMFANSWCFENYLQIPRLRTLQDTRKQLISILGRFDLELRSLGQRRTKVSRAITSGYFYHASRRDMQFCDPNYQFIYVGFVLLTTLKGKMRKFFLKPKIQIKENNEI